MLKYFLEIRNKSALLAITIFSTLLICYLYKEALLFLVTQMHLNDENLYFIFTDVTELFSVYFKLIFFCSIQIILWHFFYHLFSFLTPALYFHEFKFISFLWSSGTFFFILSCLLSSYIIIPFGWNFFLSFQSQQGFYFEARIAEYFSFYKNAYFLCLIYCQSFTLFFLFLAEIQHNYIYIKKYRKLYYYIFLIFSTIMTPPDLISQLVTTVFVIAIYETVIMLLLVKLYTN
jgi:sec-independent protein translocase protein TatC